MASTDFDPVAAKAEQRVTWNAMSKGWKAGHDEFQRAAAGMTERMLELAGIGAGQTVLDVGTGIGDPALRVAELVGPSGRVVGVDLAESMLAVARERAAGAANVEFKEGDIDSLDFPARSFDAVVSRFGLMFAADHAATFRRLAELLVPGGVLVAAVWGRHDRHLLSLGPGALAQAMELPPPPPGQPNPFSMSDPDVLTGELRASGFGEVAIEECVVSFHFAAVADYVRFNRRMIPPKMLEQIRGRFGSEDAAEPWEIVAGAVEEHAAGDGSLDLPSVALVVRAVAA
jgi:enediyne biosynthesis protein CalE5